MNEIDVHFAIYQIRPGGGQMERVAESLTTSNYGPSQALAAVALKTAIERGLVTEPGTYVLFTKLGARETAFNFDVKSKGLVVV